MNNKLVYSLLILSMVLCRGQFAIAQDSQAVAEATKKTEAAPVVATTATEPVAVSELKVDVFKAGGTEISIPQPSIDLVEVGYDIREQMEIFVPASNRLLCGFMRAEDIPRFTAGEENFVLPKYTSIQVPRAGEYQDCKTADFAELVGYVKGSFGDDIASITEESEEELNRRMKDMNLSEISIGAPKQLGTFFEKDNALCFGMVATYSDEKNSWTMVIGTTFLRVRDRLLFVYMFAKYEDEESVAMVRKVSEQWVDGILAANQ